ncbi:oligopeptide/dipeptide ABC transporter ATP-binding protein [Nonomuraea sediminis]|uniref:oligopeptide/dipeptide ABC transporter ATP-binding protein n=1 Tax=Nonomuraea sediminis TaxID=2835864 RepID=UPI001BDD5C6B|nr:oligopeptide/dipeptide ABC transporter ATP-binding protein [Nonomuraea sediminis]
MTPLIELDHVTHRYPLARRRVVHAVEDVSLRLDAGQTLAVVGESGCGKSTLARLAVGLLTPTTGSVRISGEPSTPALSRTARRAVQFVSQNPWSALNPRKTIGHSVGLPLLAHKLCATKGERSRRVAELLEQVGLPADYARRRPAGISGGELQRVTIARALAARPRAIVLDEPTASLDVGVTATVVNLLLDLRESLDVGYLLITHELDIARHLATRVAVMYLGRIVEHGPAAEVFGSPRHPYTRTLLAAVPVPDPTRRQLIAVPGEVPSSVHPPPGCAFHPRCPHATAACRDEVPALVELAGHAGRHSACLRDQEISHAADV